MLRPTVSRPVYLGGKAPIITVTVAGFLVCGALSDERTRLSSTIATGPRQRSQFLGPSPAGLMILFFCLRFDITPTWRGRPPYLYSPGTRWPSYTLRNWVPFSSPPTTLRTTVEVFEPASTRGCTVARARVTPLSHKTHGGSTHSVQRLQIH
jgi:hypothetical protein